MVAFAYLLMFADCLTGMPWGKSNCCDAGTAYSWHWHAHRQCTSSTHEQHAGKSASLRQQAADPKTIDMPGGWSLVVQLCRAQLRSQVHEVTVWPQPSLVVDLTQPDLSGGPLAMLYMRTSNSCCNKKHTDCFGTGAGLLTGHM